MLAHVDGEVLKCDQCIAELNACPACGECMYNGDKCGCSELMQALVNNRKNNVSNKLE